MSLIANLVFLIGCISPATKDICLYRVNVTLLALGLQKLALTDGGNGTELRHPDLPTYWYWGMSGEIGALLACLHHYCRALW